MPNNDGFRGPDGMYSHLIDDEANYDELSRKPDAGRSAQPVSSVRANPTPSGPGRYRLATVCLAALCVVLLISIIAVAAHNKNKTPQGGGETDPEIQKQTQDTNVTALLNKLQQENKQLQKEKDELQKERDELQKEKDELQNKLAAKMTTKVPVVVRPTPKATAAPVVCPQNWLLFGSSCYFISADRMDWSGSQIYCKSKGAHLAIILTAEEQTFLWDRLPRGHWNSYWFGITDGETEDVWKWVDGTQVVGGFWEEGEPNNHINEDCGYIVKTRVLERVAIRSWYDAPCSMSLPFICEKEM